MYKILGKDSYPQLTTEHSCIIEVHKRRVFEFREPYHKSKIVWKLLNPSTYVILEELDCKYVAKLYERVLSWTGALADYNIGNDAILKRRICLANRGRLASELQNISAVLLACAGSPL